MLYFALKLWDWSLRFYITVCESLSYDLGCLKLVLSGVAHKTGCRFTAGEMLLTLVLIENTADTRGPVWGDHRRRAGLKWVPQIKKLRVDPTHFPTSLVDHREGKKTSGKKAKKEIVYYFHCPLLYWQINLHNYSHGVAGGLHTISKVKRNMKNMKDVFIVKTQLNVLEWTRQGCVFSQMVESSVTLSKGVFVKGFSDCLQNYNQNKQITSC